MYQIKKQLKQFSAAHRLLKGYQGKCRNLHGHNYAVSVTFVSDRLDQFDFVIDFDDVSRLCDRWVNDNWDHAALISEDDKALLQFCLAENQKYYLIPHGRNTTVEFLSEHLLEQLSHLLSQETRYQHVKLQQVEIAESATAKAIFAACYSSEGPRKEDSRNPEV